MKNLRVAYKLHGLEIRVKLYVIKYALDLRTASVFDESLFKMRTFIKEPEFTHSFLIEYLSL